MVISAFIAPSRRVRSTSFLVLDYKGLNKKYGPQIDTSGNRTPIETPYERYLFEQVAVSYLQPALHKAEVHFTSNDRKAVLVKKVCQVYLSKKPNRAIFLVGMLRAFVLYIRKSASSPEYAFVVKNVGEC